MGTLNYVGPASVRSYPGGEHASNVQVGDFILAHRKGFASACIRLGQRIRYHGAKKQYAYWSHAALIVSPQGDIIEALTKGVVRGHLDQYKDVEYTLVRVDANITDQQQILKFVSKVVGESYGWATIICCFLGLLTGGWATFGFQGQAICSGCVARAQERVGAYFDRLAEDIMPADLASYYEVIR